MRKAGNTIRKIAHPASSTTRHHHIGIIRISPAWHAIS